MRTRHLLLAAISAAAVACGSPPVVSPSTGPVGSPPASPTSVATLPTASAAAAGTWTGLRWSAPTLTDPYVSIADVTAWAGGYVAVGARQRTTGAGGNVAEAWVSPDWRTWTQTLLDAPAKGESGLRRVVAVGSRLAAIGTSGVMPCKGPIGAGQLCQDAPIAIWTSGDGRTWQAEPTPAALAGVSVDGVASNGAVLVLAGDTGWDKPALWTSADGATWRRMPLPGTEFASAHFAGLIATAAGFVLTGSRGGRPPTDGVSGDSGATPAAWLSPDGMTWQAATVTGDPSAPDDAIGRVFAGNAGLIAWKSGGSSFGWLSKDGRAWTARPRPTGNPINPQTSDGSRIIADSYGDGGSQAWWVSTDAVSWQPLAVSGDVEDAPVWDSSSGAAADAEFLFPGGMGVVGQNGTTRTPVWWAAGVAP